MGLSPRRIVEKVGPLLKAPFARDVPPPGMAATSIRLLPGLSVPNPIARRPVETLGRIGSLEVRLARTAGEIRQAQELRYHVFYEEMAAIADASTLATRRDRDAFDRICDHLLVVDHDDLRPGRFGRQRPRIVGTYRLLRQDVAEANGGFYTAGEFDVGPLMTRHGNARFLELGRSCVLKPYRTKRTVELLWHGIWAYVLQHGIDAMFGCASIEGTDPDRLALPLAFLHHHARAPEPWRVAALPERFVAMDRLPKDEIDTRAALHALPPLIKGYLRLGASIGDGAVIDHQFGTTDVLVVLPVSAISSRYITYYGADAGRHAA